MTPLLRTGYSARTLFLRIPIFSISTSTVSPCLSQRGGLRAMPTPLGVPVRMMVPGDILAGLPCRAGPDDEGELGLEVGLVTARGGILADLGDDDVLAIEDCAGGTLSEDHRTGGDIGGLLLGVIGVVAADADDVA